MPINKQHTLSIYVYIGVMLTFSTNQSHIIHSHYITAYFNTLALFRAFRFFKIRIMEKVISHFIPLRLVALFMRIA